MRTTLALVLLASSADALRMMALRMMATGFAPPAPPPTAAPARSIFRWAEGKGVECGGPLSVREFEGVRGVAAVGGGVRIVGIVGVCAPPFGVLDEEEGMGWDEEEGMERIVFQGRAENLPENLCSRITQCTGLDRSGTAHTWNADRGAHWCQEPY